jgi:hypothetical protein
MTTDPLISEQLRRHPVDQRRRCRSNRPMRRRYARVARLPVSLLTHGLALRDAA